MRLLDLLIKGAGHKYIKRIPVGTTKTGKVRYRYIYSATHTVGGKHLLDEAHLKPGAKLMLHSKDGAEVHAHIESVKGDQVTFTYDDGERKGETRTVSKQQLLAEFNKEHKVGEQIDSAKAALLADIRAAGEKGFSKKQLARLVARLERLGGSVDKEESTERDPASKDDNQIIGDHYDNAPKEPPRLSADEMRAMSEDQLRQEMRERNRYISAMASLIHKDPLNAADQRKLNAIEEERRNAPDDEDWRVTDERDAKRDAMFNKIEARKRQLFLDLVNPIAEQIIDMQVLRVQLSRKRRKKEARAKNAEKKREQARRAAAKAKS